MKLVIFGSRKIPLELGLLTIHKALGSELSSVTEEISGTAIGADDIGEIFARTHGIPVKQFPPDKSLGFPAALFVRNTEMAKYCDSGIALWDGKSTGTQHMMKQMTKFQKPFAVYIIDATPEPKGLEKFFDE
jgi:hypothetical protein